ncbi:MAG: hypothetical protein JRG91_17655 [Deltaproteobacteria bacterium]|nr:hypothetical protein [Deltaproteobacteria bacterium]
MRQIPIILALLALGCADVCPGHGLMQRMLDDPDLCGSRGTAVDCRTTCPTLEDDSFEGGWEGLYEVSKYTARKSEIGPIGRPRRGYWYLGIEPPSQARFRIVPHGEGVPVVTPRSALRSSRKILKKNATRMSLYFQYSDIQQGCILDIDEVWSWTLKKPGYLIFGEDFVASAKVKRRRGVCPEPSWSVPGKGEAWRIEGTLWRTS